LISTSKSEISLVQKEQTEYFLIGSYNRTPGLKLLGYSYEKDEIIEIQTKKENSVALKEVNGKLIPENASNESCLLDTRLVYFESLNLNCAKKRVAKHKKLNTIGNLRPIGNIKTF